MKTTSDDIYLIKITGATIGVNTTAYADNDLVGELITVANATMPGKGCILVSVVLQDLTNQKAALDLVIFDSNPAASTFTNNSTFTIADADLPRVIGHIPIASTDYHSFADNAVGTVEGKSLILKPAYGSTLYFCLRSNVATPTYAANELSMVIGVLLAE